MQEPIEILLKKGVSGADGSTPATPSPSNQPNAPERAQPETNPTAQLVAAQVVSVAKQGMLIGLRNYGDITGESRKQQSIENAINIAGAIGTIAVAGPFVGGAILVGQSVLAGIQSSVTQNLERRKVDFDNERLGVISKYGNR